MRERATVRKASPPAPPAPVVEISMGSAQDALGELVARARISGQRTVLMRYGKAVAAIVPIADYKRLTAA